MFAKRSKLTIIGAIMIIIQLISIISVSFSVAGLYPGHDHLVQDGYYIDYNSADFKPYMIPIAMNAGFEKFISSFGEIFTINGSGKILSAAQFNSAGFRGALMYGTKGGNQAGLFLYDLILTFTYSIVGLTGLGLLIAGILIERKKQKKNPQPIETVTPIECDTPN